MSDAALRAGRATLTRSTSKVSSLFGGISFVPREPCPSRAGTIMRRLPPTRIPTTPSFNPSTTAGSGVPR